MEIRNIAIIAHVDHGKTTLTDSLMRQTGMSNEGATMDSNSIEQERGITIYAKNTSLNYKDTKINIVDTPGHADFGSEVERVLRAIDVVILVVDAQEGPMPQTRFVLKKSLELGLKAIVVINKIDKPAAQPDVVQEQVYELFLDLGANDEQLDFTTVYAIAREGVAKMALEDQSHDLTPLLETIIAKVPAATGDPAAPLRLQPFNLAYDDYLGRLAVGRIHDGTIKTGGTVVVRAIDGSTRTGKITKLYTFRGTDRQETDHAVAGDIVMLAGLPDIYIGETISATVDEEPLPAITVDEPTITLDFMVNNSPLAGREGTYVTSKQIRERLMKELEINVGLKVDFADADSFKVSGRGELHIAVLVEQMRREGYELQISQPQVIIKKDEAGGKLEPFEEVIIDVPTAYSGSVIEKLAKRRGTMTSMAPAGDQSKMTFEIPTRGLLGYRGEFVVDTRGEGILYTRVLGFKPYVGAIEKRSVGSMISMETGNVAGYALDNLQNRGILYVGPATYVYAGMVIGNVTKGDDMTVNPIKGKALTNMRASGSDDTIKLSPPWEITLERGMEVMADDEYLEVTPKSTRLRKKFLSENDRIRAARSAKE